MMENKETKRITDSSAEEVTGGSIASKRRSKYIWKCKSCMAHGELSSEVLIPPCPNCGSNDVLRVRSN
jgi:predicted RNA-binding Zn-ribbon protein involved in translation (DUF1610 family)